MRKGDKNDKEALLLRRKEQGKWGNRATKSGSSYW